jgi:RNA polymerase sigma factor (TIGR02999 family)
MAAAGGAGFSPDSEVAMDRPDKAGVTVLLKRLSAGDRDCLDELISLVYEDMRRLAAAALRGERPGQTVQPTSLVHEAYMRLVDQTGIDWQDRAHFFAIAAREMRRALIDHARERMAQKRGGGRQRFTIVEGDAQTLGPQTDLLDLNEALEELSRLKERHGQVVEFRFFGRMTNKEIAHVLGVSPETIKKDWQFARAWLGRRLERGGAT